MEYLLVVLTHDRGETLGATMGSFVKHVTPEPTDWVLIEDGPPVDADLWRFRRLGLGKGEGGFCAAVAAGWVEARRTPCPWVFWLEHDFIFTRPVDLHNLATVLRGDRALAQMSLMRQPVSDLEIADGRVLGLDAERVSDVTGARWTEQSAYWTTNPSLFRSALTHTNAWPEGPECEGKFGIELRERGYRFGVWDWGEQYVEHIGKRTGKGY